MQKILTRLNKQLEEQMPEEIRQIREFYFEKNKNAEVGETSATKDVKPFSEDYYGRNRP